MADREKVILALKTHADGCGYRSHHCDAMECPYRYGDESCDIEQMCRDAYELLKEQEDMGKELTDAMELVHKKNARIIELTDLLIEQEAVKPYHVNTNYEQHWKCGNCNAVISPQDKYCSACGKPIL